MKKSFLLITILALFFSCSDDDNDPVVGGETETEDIIRISQVDSQSDLVVLSNLGTATTDISDYWLCLGPGTYVRVSDATDDVTDLAPNESVTLSYDVNEEADGLSIFSTNTFTSTDPTILVDYVQWGAADQARVDQAVTAGRWDDAANFVAVGDSYTFIGEATDFGSSFYETAIGATETPVLRILQVNAALDQVWLSNYGTETIDIADYWLCLGPGTYEQVSAATTESTMIAPGENIMVSYDVNEEADGLSIFSINTFGSSDPTVLVDYVQWGAADQARVDQAVTAGRWDDAANFVAVGESYTFTGEATDFGSSFYETAIGATETPVLRILQVNAASDQVWLSNFGTETIDVADYWLCLGPGTYEQISAATTDSTTLAPGENLMVSYDVNEVADGLSIFSTNVFGSSDPTILLDYVQWGAADQARVDQAVTAGRWDDVANFVAVGDSYTFTGEAADFGSTFYETAIAEGILRVLQVDASLDQVWLSNFGTASMDIADYWLCLGPGTYVQVSAATTDSTTLAPGENLMVSYDVNEEADGLSIFSINTFGSSDPTILVDYVQWGAADQARVGQAVTAGRWDDAANYVSGGPIYTFTGTATDFGVTFW